MESGEAKLKMIEVANSELVMKFEQLNTKTNQEEAYGFNIFKNNIKKRPPNQRTFLIEIQDKPVIDVESLFDRKYAISYLEKIIDYYPLKSLSEIQQFVWLESLIKSNLYYLFEALSNDFIKYLPINKLVDNYESGSCYTKWHNYDIFKESLPKLQKSNQFFNLYILVLVDNHANENKKGFFIFELDHNGVEIILKDERIKFQLTDIIEMSKRGKEMSVDLVKNYINIFQKIFSLPLPTKENQVNLNQDFIHYVEFSFEYKNPE